MNHGPHNLGPNLGRWDYQPITYRDPNVALIRTGNHRVVYVPEHKPVQTTKLDEAVLRLVKSSPAKFIDILDRLPAEVLPPWHRNRAVSRSLERLQDRRKVRRINGAWTAKMRA